MKAYYNEFNPAKAEWLRELIKAGAMPAGEVDERSITEVQPADLVGFDQCHFFAGIGVWTYSLRLAGWPDDRPVWTASCPCQPFSVAGKRQGEKDERHLWPELHRLVGARRPRRLYLEQVASRDGLAWLDLVSTNMEGSNYSGWTFDLCAAGFGAPHIRQRQWGVWIVADRDGERRDRFQIPIQPGEQGQTSPEIAWSCSPGVVLDDTKRAGLEGYSRHGHNSGGWQEQARPIAPAGVVNGHWAGAELIPCTDGKWRPIEPGIEPLVDGPASGLVRVRDASGLNPETEARETFPLIRKARARTLRLRGYGDAIVAPLAAAFIRATSEVIG